MILFIKCILILSQSNINKIINLKAQFLDSPPNYISFCISSLLSYSLPVTYWSITLLGYARYAALRAHCCIICSQPLSIPACKIVTRIWHASFLVASIDSGFIIGFCSLLNFQSLRITCFKLFDGQIEGVWYVLDYCFTDHLTST